MNDLTPPDLKQALDGIRDLEGADVLSMMLRVFHGLLGAMPAAKNAGVEEELARQIAAYRARGQRLEEALDAGTKLLANDIWVTSDFIALLNSIARFSSACAERAVREENEHAKVMSVFLCEVLYDHLGGLAETRKWFYLDRIIPLESDFDAKRQKAVGAKSLAGHTGKVLEIVSVGICDNQGLAIEPAHVIAVR